MGYRTVFAALALALFGTGAAIAQDDVRYALDITMEEDGHIVWQPNLVVVAGTPYSIDLPNQPGTQLSLRVSRDTRRAVIEAFDRDLGTRASGFIFVDTELLVASISDQGLREQTPAADADVLLSLTGHPISVEASLNGGDRMLHMSAQVFGQSAF